MDIPISKKVSSSSTDKLYWVWYSSLALVASARNSLQFFQKNTGEFTNMKRQGSFAKGNHFNLKGISAYFYNTSGFLFKWGDDTIAGLTQFWNQCVVKLRIENKDYLELPLTTIMKTPDTSAANIAAYSGGVDNRMQKPVLILPTAHLIEAERSFDITAEGTTGAFSASSRFVAETRMIVELHGILYRPVQ